MNALTNRWKNGLLDEWIIGLMDSPGVAGSVIHLSTNPKIHTSRRPCIPCSIILSTLPRLRCGGSARRFANGRSVYHTSDTALHPLVLAAAPREPDVMLVPINGKWGNPGPEQAAEFAATLRPRFVLPNHYDL